MTTRHTFSAHAALIPLLHAARFPHETVIGCLLGPASTADDNDDERDIQCEHAIPLLHHWTGLSPAIEMAMTFVEEYAALKTWTVLGFYFANEGLGELTPLDPTKLQIPILIKRLQAQAGPDVSFFALDNRNLTTPNAFVLLPSSTFPSSTSSISYNTPKANPSNLPALVKAGQHKQVEDFDLHLEDIGARWLKNEEVDLEVLSKEG